jgi:hypothetical protein
LAEFVRHSFIYLAAKERHQEDAITAYFETAGHDVLVMPCPNFEASKAENHLSNHNIVFVSDLPRHVIPAGIKILHANQHNDSPNLDWMAAPPNTSSFMSLHASSSCQSLHSSQPLLSLRATSHQEGRGNCRPDLDGVDFNEVLYHSVSSMVFMGGSVASQGGISSTTIHKSRRMGGVPSSLLHASPPHSVVSSPVPLPPSSSSITSIQEAIPAKASPVHVTSIKDKPLDIGLKEITDKALWIEAKVVIDSRLRHTPFWPSPISEAPITMPENMVASAWWEELLYYYLKPPVRDLFMEESRFYGKGFEMLYYIDKHLNPSSAINLLGYIFDLINIEQRADRCCHSPSGLFTCICFTENGGCGHWVGPASGFHVAISPIMLQRSGH